MNFVSLFSGIGGFDLAFERVGMRAEAQVEIDARCGELLGKRFDAVPLHTDISGVRGDQFSGIDLICGGFPCQDISVSGRGAGLAGSRSGLWWEYHRLLEEVRPEWCVIENVAGLLSSGGRRDLGAILGALGDLGYGFAYRVLDSQWFGVPQRRRRVFIVGHLGGGSAPAQVLLEREGLRGDPAPSREAGPAVTPALSTGGGKPGMGYPAIHLDEIVRRLTPLECERLQGFPDGWTEGFADSTRYRMLGNAVTVPVVEWIGRRIMEVAA